MAYKCFRCGISLASEQSLTYHLNKAKPCIDLKCKKCNKLFTNSATLKNHQQECISKPTITELRHNTYDLILSDNILILEHDNDCILNYASKSSMKVLGYSPSELIGNSKYDIIYEHDLPYVLKMKNECNKNTRFRYKHKNGK